MIELGNVGLLNLSHLLFCRVRNVRCRYWTANCGDNVECQYVVDERPPAVAISTLLTNADNGMSVRQKAKVVVKDASPVKEGQGKAKDGLKPLLEAVQTSSLFIGELLVDVVLTKGEYRD